MAVENSRRGCDVVEHRFVEAALASVKVALFERHGGSALPCMWLCGSGICIKKLALIYQTKNARSLHWQIYSLLFCENMI
jgi:hypothetical protein